MQASLTAGMQATACVIYYGMPEENLDRLKSLNGDVLDIWGTKDGWINAEVAKKFEANMKAAGKSLSIKSYDADHGFANPSNPMGNFNEVAYKDAYKNTVAVNYKGFSYCPNETTPKSFLDRVERLAGER
jgi:carboxymethylenebutenolidase